MSADWLHFKGNIDDIDRPLLSDQLETNLFAWLNHCLLDIGGYSSITIPTSGAYGGSYHVLEPLRDANYDEGRIWQAFRKDWVWESGTYAGREPIHVSGVFVGGIFRPTSGVGPYAHKVNYPLGQIIFDSPVSTTSTVTCEYSFRRWQIATADAPFWREIQFDSYRADNPHFGQIGSGDWAGAGQSRIQLPAVVIEAAPKTSRYAYELGNQTAVVTQDVTLHILAESHWDRKQMHDILTCQWQKRIQAFDKSLMLAGSGAPLDEYGSPREASLSYSDWVKPASEGGYAWKVVTFQEVASFPGQSAPPLYTCSVRLGCQIELP